MTTPIKYRISSTATKPMSDSVKGAPLTSLEIDGNFRSIKDSIETIQSGYLPAGYTAPVEYAAGIILSSASQTVSYLGEVYAPVAAEVPFTTSGVFEVTKFVQIQSVASVDLASPTGGDSLIGTAAAPGGLWTTVRGFISTLLSSVGSSIVGYEDTNVQAVLHQGKPLANYAALRDYAGTATQIRITDSGISGFFYYDATDTTSVDNGGTIIVSGNGRRWKRLFEGAVNVKWFGASGNGVDATDDFSRAFATGKAVYAPAGTYLLNFLNVPSNTILFGDGTNTIIKPIMAGIRCALGADSGSASAFIENITIKDVKFLGDVATQGFAEQSHLTSFNGVKNLLVENCHFVGFRGDGLYLGSGNTGGQERHNVNVTIRNCVFDGINADNRNGISIIDGDTVTIDGCLFTNTTRAGMPGSIDCEPDANAFAVIRNITIRGNRFIGGNEAAIALLLLDQSFVKVPHENFLIEGNFIEKPKGFTFNGENNSLGDSTKPYGVVFFRNVVKGSNTPFLIDGGRGVTLQENSFEESAYPAEFGYVTGNYDCNIIANTFYRCGQDNVLGTRGLWIRTANRLTIDGNSFVDCGRANGTAGRAIEFVSGLGGSHIYLRNNEFSSPTGKTNYVIFASGYTFDNGTCEDLNNKYLFVSNNDFQGKYGTYTAAPTGGTWAKGNFVYNAAPGSSGVLGWLCVSAGTPGLWQAMSTRVPFRRYINRNYATTENFDASQYDIFSLNVQSNPPLTYNSPSGGTSGQEITIQVRNISGGPMGTITWNSAFKMSSWTNPANGFSRSITFVYSGSNWVEISRTVTDIPN